MNRVWICVMAGVFAVSASASSWSWYSHKNNNKKSYVKRCIQKWNNDKHDADKDHSSKSKSHKKFWWSKKDHNPKPSTPKCCKKDCKNQKCYGKWCKLDHCSKCKKSSKCCNDDCKNKKCYGWWCKLRHCPKCKPCPPKEPDCPDTTPSIDIRKQEEGPDMRTVAPGSDVDFVIEITNTGDEDLTNVVVTSDDAAECAMTVGNLAIGETVTYICSRFDVREDFTCSVTVTGSSQCETVTDSDESSIKVEEMGCRVECDAVVVEVIAMKKGVIEVTFSVTNDCGVADAYVDTGCTTADVAVGTEIELECVPDNNGDNGTGEPGENCRADYEGSLLVVKAPEAFLIVETLDEAGNLQECIIDLCALLD